MRIRFTPILRVILLCIGVTAAPIGSAHAQDAADATTPAPDPIACQSSAGARQHCPANTSSGVALVEIHGAAACLLGKTWGYDDTGIWVSDGCSGEFVAGAVAEPPAEKTRLVRAERRIPLFSVDKGEMYVRLFSYARYLNQRSLDGSFVNFFGNTQSRQQRQDIQLNKFFLPFSGWFLTPKFRYYLYVWSANTSQGDPAQVVGAGNLSYAFSDFVMFGAGITSLPSVRSTEGQFRMALS